jgi:hypothetical protein
MASATPVPFTWDPSGLPALAAGGPAFTADGIVAADYVYAHQAATNNVPYPASFVFAVTGFTLQGAPVTTLGLGSSYGLYLRIDETDVLINGLGTTVSGTVRLIADLTNDDGTLSTTVANQIAFSNPAGTADDITLASRSILSSLFKIPAGGPVSKFWLTEFIPAAGTSAFFVSPQSNHLELEILNTNTPASRQFLLQSDFSGITLVNGAVGTIDVTVPEPGSIVLLSAGLLGLIGLGWQASFRRSG